MILVVGASGTNGRQVVERLVALGKPVRALVRNPGKESGFGAGVEVVAGDLDQPASLDTALRGVTDVFLLTPVDQRAVRWGNDFIAAAQRVGGIHIVKFSGMGATPDAGCEILRQHAQIDETLIASGLPWTIIRPNSFFQNMLWSVPTIKQQSAFYLPMRDGRQSLVDVRDIADVATAILTRAGHEGKTYEITGPEGLSYADVANVLSKVLGKPIQYIDVPPEAARQGMLQAGMLEWNANAVTELYGMFASGKYAYTTDAVQSVTGKQPRSFEQFVRDHAAAFR